MCRIALAQSVAKTARLLVASGWVLSCSSSSEHYLVLCLLLLLVGDDILALLPAYLPAKEPIALTRLLWGCWTAFAGQGLPGSQDKEVSHSGYVCFLICLFPLSSACSFQNALLCWSGQHDLELDERAFQVTGAYRQDSLTRPCRSLQCHHLSLVHASIGNSFLRQYLFLASPTLWYFFFLIAQDGVVHSSR